MAQEWLSGGEQTLLMNDCAGARRSGPGRSSSAPEELMPIQAKGQVRAFAFAFLGSATLFHTKEAVLYMRSPCMQEEFPFFAIFGQLPWQQEAVSCWLISIPSSKFLSLVQCPESCCPLETKFEVVISSRC